MDIPSFDFPVDCDSADYDWLIKHAVEAMQFTVKGISLESDLYDAKGTDIGGWCQTFFMAGVWRMRNVIDPVRFPLV